MGERRRWGWGGDDVFQNREKNLMIIVQSNALISILGTMYFVKRLKEVWSGCLFGCVLLTLENADEKWLVEK